jgi:Bacterial regulatory protein, Fis family
VKAERDLVLATLKQGSNNRVQTAKVLGMPRSTLDKKLKQYAASGAPIPPAQNGGFRAARWSSQGAERAARSATGSPIPTAGENSGDDGVRGAPVTSPSTLNATPKLLWSHGVLK